VRTRCRRSRQRRSAGARLKAAASSRATTVKTMVVLKYARTCGLWLPGITISATRLLSGCRLRATARMKLSGYRASLRLWSAQEHQTDHGPSGKDRWQRSAPTHSPGGRPAAAIRGRIFLSAARLGNGVTLGGALSTGRPGPALQDERARTTRRSPGTRSRAPSCSSLRATEW
jgi:hypothetical protein